MLQDKGAMLQDKGANAVRQGCQCCKTRVPMSQGVRVDVCVMKREFDWIMS